MSDVWEDIRSGSDEEWIPSGPLTGTVRDVKRMQNERNRQRMLVKQHLSRQNMKSASGTADDPTSAQREAFVDRSKTKDIPSEVKTIVLGSHAATDLSSTSGDFTVEFPTIHNVRHISLDMARTPSTRRTVRESDSIAWEPTIKVNGQLRITISPDDKSAVTIQLPGTLQEVEVDGSTLRLLGTAVDISSITMQPGGSVARVTTSTPHMLLVGDSVLLNTTAYSTATVDAVVSDTVFDTDVTYTSGSTGGDSVQQRLIPHKLSDARAVLVSGGINSGSPPTLTETTATEFTSGTSLTTTAAPRAYLYTSPRNCDEFMQYIMALVNTELTSLGSVTRVRIARQSASLEGYVGAFSYIAERVGAAISTLPSVSVTLSGHGASSVATVFPLTLNIQSVATLYRPLPVVCRLPAGRPSPDQMADWITGCTGFIKTEPTTATDLHVNTAEGLSVDVNLDLGHYPTPYLASSLQEQINDALQTAKGSVPSTTVVVSFSATTGKFTFTTSDSSILTLRILSQSLQAALGMRELVAFSSSVVSDYSLPYRSGTTQSIAMISANANTRERKMYVSLPMHPNVIVDRSTGYGSINYNGTSKALVAGYVPGDVVRVTVGDHKYLCTVLTSGSALTVEGIGPSAPSVGSAPTMVVSPYASSTITFNCAPLSRKVGTEGDQNVVSIGTTDAYLMPSIVGLPHRLVENFMEGFLPNVYQLTPCGEMAMRLYVNEGVDVSGNHIVLGETNRVSHTFGLVAPSDPETGLSVFGNNNTVTLSRKISIRKVRIQFVDTHTLRTVDFAGGLVTVTLRLVTRI